jgi:hypothetical protein
MPRWTLKDLQKIQGTPTTSLAELREEMRAVARGEATAKYHNEPFVYLGRKYASKLEARLAQDLDLEWRAGTVLWFTRQIPFDLEGGVTYRADFLVARPWGSASAPLYLELIDATGVMTPTKRNKLRQVHDRYGIITKIYRRDGSLVPYLEVPVTRRKPQSLPGPLVEPV